MSDDWKYDAQSDRVLCKHRDYEGICPTCQIDFIARITRRK